VRVFWVVFLAGCSSSSPAGTADADLHEDAGTEAAAPPPAPPTLPACLGESRPIVLDAGLPFAEAQLGSYTGQMLVDFATTRSTIDLAAFPPPGPTATGCDPTKLGQACTFSDYDFFGPWGSVTLITADHSGGTVRQAGIIGTDFLSVHVFTLDYRQKRIFEAPKACDDASLAAFTPLTTTGDPVPTVPVRVGGTGAIAQLDTGFADSLVRHSVNVNVALFDTIPKSALARDASLDAQLTTCAGVAEAVEAYRLASFELGKHAWTDAVLFVKRTPPAAQKCGGIGTWTTPAAQIGASFFVDIGVLVFDPFSKRVWIGD
jgi:hypothetical protein